MTKTVRIPDCDICKHEDGVVTPAVWDSKTKNGPWAFMCGPHAVTHGDSNVKATKLGAKK